VADFDKKRLLQTLADDERRMAQMRELVTTQASEVVREFVLLKPAYTPARTGDTYQYLGSMDDVTTALTMADRSQYVAVDFETKGNDYSDPANPIEIVGVGLAWDTGSIYFHWDHLSPYYRGIVAGFLLTHKGLLAHNMYFDGGVIRALFGRHATFAACTLSLYMHLANEGWTGQKWGLKDAQKDVLKWENSNEHDLDRWLVCNGHYRGVKRLDDSPEARLLGYENTSLKADKGEMWRAPAEILGKYCVLDAEACYLLYTEHLLPVSKQFPEFHEQLWPRMLQLIETHIEQKLNGLLVDRIGIEARHQLLEGTITHRVQALRSNPTLEPHIREIEASLLSDLAEKEPPRFKKMKERPTEPPAFKKDGTPSKAHATWVANGPKYLVQVKNKNWIAWRKRWRLAVVGETPEYRFNFGSPLQLGDLLYARLGYPVRIKTDKGQPAVGIKALKHLGEIGTALIEKAWDEKELGYLTDYLERTVTRPSIHPNFRLPGTKTGRLSSSKPNLQQVPKTKAMMSLFKAKPGMILVDLDFSALEPVVTTEFSQDPNMLAIYGDGRPSNDIYLFVASSIPGYAEKVKAAGYDPYNPTKEGLANAKKLCKAERSVCKTVALACAYGAGVDKVLATLEADDVFLPRDEVEKIHRGYWDLFGEVKQFGRDLQRQWKRNGGYVLNGLGRPMCLPEDYKHDVLNRFIQSTGHDILIQYIYILTNGLTDAGIDWKPWVIDWHDAAAVEVPEHQKDVTIEVYLWALDELNRQLGGQIKLKGVPSWGKTMADIKEPES
jgi:hypothetical protein